MQKSQSISEPQYRYADLPSQTAKDRARNHYIEHWIIDDWYDSVYYDYKSEGVVQGFDIDDIAFSGFWSQGDGAMWTGFVDLPKFITSFMPESIGRDCWLWLIEDGWLDDRAGIYRSSHHYSHSNCMGISSPTTVGNNEDDKLRVECILTNAPIDTLWNLIVADPNCPIKDVDDLEELMLEKARQYADEIYDGLSEAYDYECSDENVSECYDANDILFNEEGEIIK